MKKYKSIKVECPNCKREMEFAIMEEEMEKRKIEVTKLGVKSGSGYNDRIAVEFSPNELEWMKNIFIDRALEAPTYVNQTEDREMVEVFEEAYKMWNKRRKEGDEKAG